MRATISRTGYTGEDGFEIFVPPQSADRVWLALLEAGQAVDVVPCGLGARDTLRLEAAMRLHGNDIDETTTAARSGSRLDRRLEQGRLPRRRRAARSRRAAGVARKLVGFEMVDRGIARQGHDVYVGDRARRRGDERHADAVPEEGDRHGATCRSSTRRPAPSSTSTSAAAATRAQVVPMPFYKRQK